MSANIAEARDPRRDYPRAPIGALLIAGLLYVLVGLAVSVAAPQDADASSAPLLDVVAASPVPVPVPESAFAVIALIAVANVSVLVLPRPQEGEQESLRTWWPVPLLALGPCVLYAATRVARSRTAPTG